MKIVGLKSEVLNRQFSIKNLKFNIVYNFPTFLINGGVDMASSLIDFIRKKHHYGRYKIVKKLMQGHGKNLLDIGCGSPARCVKEGSFLRYVGYGHGIDIKPCNIEFDFKIGDMQNIPFGNEKFDVITAIEVIEHVENPSKALKEVHRVLKKGGIFVMTTPNTNLFFRTFWWAWERTFGREWKHTHLTPMTKVEWLELIEKSNGFKISKVIDYCRINLIIKMIKI